MVKKKKGKYADIDVAGLPVKPPDDLERQDQINLVKSELEAMPTLKLAEIYAQLRRRHARLALESAAIWLQVEAAQQMLASSQEKKDPAWGQYGAEENALRLPDGSTIRVEKQPCARVIDKEAFHKWVHDNGYASKFMIHHGTMESWVKERLLTGDATPDGTEANHFTKVVFTDAKS